MSALIGSGAYSILLVLSRAPWVNQWLPTADFFHVALVTHVDLSVLVWFIATAGILWTLNGAVRGMRLAWSALGLCCVGAVLMMLAPFIGVGEPIMANYIPVLTGAPFMVGLQFRGSF